MRTYSHVVLVDMEKGLGEAGHVDHTDHICLVRLDEEGHILRFSDESRIRHRLGTVCVLFRREIVRNQNWHLLMIPIGQGNDNFVVNLIRVWVFEILDNEGAAQAVNHWRTDVSGNCNTLCGWN